MWRAFGLADPDAPAALLRDRAAAAVTMILLVRHGRTAANADGLLLGRLDPGLDAEGERQAVAVAGARRRRRSGPARVVSSPAAAVPRDGRR